MTATPNIELDLLPVGGSTQDQVTVNENSVILSALVQSRVNDKDLTAPPGGETNGLSFIVGPSATGAWAGHDDDIAVWIELVAGSGFWTFHTPLQGWSTFIVDENKRYEYTGSAWQEWVGGGIGNIVEDVTPQLGGMLDVNGQTIGDGVSALLSFVEDAFAVNNVEIENEASGFGPIIRAVGADTNIDLLINAKGTGNVLFNGSNAIFGDPGVEESGITIGGVTYNSSLKVSGIGGSDLAQTILHRHSTTLPPAMVAARSHSNTSSHAVVLDNDILFGLYGAGHDGTDYELAAAITMEVDGTPGNNDMPGRIVFSTTPNGGVAPVEVLRLNNSGDAIFTNDLIVDTDLLFADSTNGRVGVGTASPDNTFHIKDTTTVAKIEATTGNATLEIDATNSSRIFILEGGVERWRITYSSSGNFFQWYDSGRSAAVLKFNDGANTEFLVADVDIQSNLILSSPTVPASASAAGVTGTVAWDSSFIYICTATNTWERVAIATW